MRLGIDLRCLPSDGSAGGGIAHAARAVTETLVGIGGCEIICYVPQNVAAPNVDAIMRLPDARRASLVDGLRHHPCDLLFVPSGAVSPMLPVLAVPWVHDCDIFDHPEWFPQSWWKRQITTRLFLRGIRRAPHIFAASEYTKRAIERLVPSAKGRITVTGEGGDAELASIPSDGLADVKRQAVARLIAHGITRPFVLMLGTLEPRKNVSFICRLWPQVAQAIAGTDLIIAGQDGWKTSPIHAAIQQCQHELTSIDSRLILFQKKHPTNRETFSEQDRRDLLLAARAVLVPSLSEGAGLVALEAIQAGTPVLVSNRGALPEVVGEGEWLLDPEDASAWQAAIIQMLSDSAARERIRLAQQDRRTTHSREQTARIIMENIIPSPRVPPQADLLPKKTVD